MEHPLTTAKGNESAVHARITSHLFSAATQSSWITHELRGVSFPACQLFPSYIWSLTNMKGTKKSWVHKSGVPVVVARHMNERVYNNAVCICCTSLAIAQGCPCSETKSETYIIVRERKGNREKFKRNSNGAFNMFFQTLYFIIWEYAIKLPQLKYQLVNH